MIEANWLTILLGFEDRRTVVAHEVAHQWWGHMVAWESYRDRGARGDAGGARSFLPLRTVLQAP